MFKMIRQYVYDLEQTSHILQNHKQCLMPFIVHHKELLISWICMGMRLIFVLAQ